MSRGDPHTDIQNTLYETLRYTLVADTYGSPAHYEDATIAKEQQIGQRRADVALETPDENYAFEVKISRTDYKRYPGQATDYQRAGFEPVLVATPDVYAGLDGEPIPAGWCMLYEDGMSFIGGGPESLRPLETKWSTVSPEAVWHELSPTQLPRPE